VQNVTIAGISEHYGLAKSLRANQSQLASLQRSIYVQGASVLFPNVSLSIDIWASLRITADLFEVCAHSHSTKEINSDSGAFLQAYIGGLYDDWGWEYVKPWLSKVLLPYVQEAHRIVQGAYYQSRGHDRDPPDLGGGLDPRSPSSHLADGPSPGPRRQNALGFSHSPHLGGPSTPSTFSKTSSPLVQTSSPGVFPPPLIPEGHLSLLNQILQHARRNMDWDFVMDPSSPTTTPVWDAEGKLSNVIIAEGRGNTKKLAKNDGARRLVLDLQDALSRSKHAQTIPNLAKQLALHLEKVKQKRDKKEEVSRFDNPCLVDKSLAYREMQGFCRPDKDCRLYKNLPVIL